jgi:transcriptional regulator NrdR family protein
MECPACRSGSNRVTFSKKNGAVVERIRKCSSCGKSFHSREHLVKSEAHSTNRVKPVANRT